MTITLPPDQLAWIEARVASGEFSDVDEAVSRLLTSAILEHEELESDDLSPAKPLVEEALAAAERGETMTLEDFEAHLETKFGAPAK